MNYNTAKWVLDRWYFVALFYALLIVGYGLNLWRVNRQWMRQLRERDEREATKRRSSPCTVLLFPDRRANGKQREG